MAFTIEIQNLDKLMKRFERYRGKAKKAVFRGIKRTAVEVQDEARKNAPYKTSNLARSIHITNEDPDALRITVQTTDNSRKYAAYQEFGYQGVMIVREHEREMTHVWGRKLTSPLKVTVRAHTRFYNYDGFGYMATARLKGETRIQGNIEKELNAVKL